MKAKSQFLAPGAGIAGVAKLIESRTPCRDAKVVRPYPVSSPLHLTALATKSEDCTTASQHHLAIIATNIVS